MQVVRDQQDGLLLGDRGEQPVQPIMSPDAASDGPSRSSPNTAEAALAAPESQRARSEPAQHA